MQKIFSFFFSFRRKTQKKSREMEKRQKFCEFRRMEASEECSRMCFIEKEKKFCVFGEEWCEEKNFLCFSNFVEKEKKLNCVIYTIIFRWFLEIKEMKDNEYDYGILQKFDRFVVFIIYFYKNRGFKKG